MVPGVSFRQLGMVVTKIYRYIVRCQTGCFGAYPKRALSGSCDVSSTLFVPPDARLASGTEITEMSRILRGKRVLALTGAGISTESGIPDYRGPVSSRTPRKPVTHNEFLQSGYARKRYWIRSMSGWKTVRTAEPNAAHLGVACLERAGVVTAVLTQNVDGLHQKAGSSRVLELHGSLFDVECTGCGSVLSRDSVQERLEQLNPDAETEVAEYAPDGDTELKNEDSAKFRIPACDACGGILKPGVVFFGGRVPEDTVRQAWSLLDEADAVLVLGSSLTVYSGFRFVDKAFRDGKPVGILTLGQTRADSLASVRINARLGDGVSRLVKMLVP
jgi:NAD+-dependent protein deacetylase sirtuin 4